MQNIKPNKKPDFQRKGKVSLSFIVNVAMSTK